MKKNDYIILGILSFIFIALVFIYTGFNDVYGSMTDWVMQHTVIPDYFRTLFYETGNISLIAQCRRRAKCVLSFLLWIA